MKIVVDRSRCQGYGMCESFSPEIFELDGDGELVLRTEEVPEGAEDDVQTAVMSCPTEALSLES